MKRAYGGNVWTANKSSPTTVFDLRDRIVFVGSSFLSVLVVCFIIAGRSIPSHFFLQAGAGSGLWESKTLLYWIIAMGSGLTFCASALMFLILFRLGNYREFAPSTKFVFWTILPLTAIFCFVFMMSFSGH
jgi:hypothetical protein